MRRSFVLALGLASCTELDISDIEDTGGSPPSEICDGRPIADAEALTDGVTLSQRDNPGVTPPTAPEVVSTDAAWTDWVAALGTDLGWTPDFSADVVFVHGWVDGGCEPAFDYAVWRFPDGRVRARAVQDGVDGGCDAYFPNLTLIWVRGVAGTDVGWCVVDAPREPPPSSLRSARALAHL